MEDASCRIGGYEIWQILSRVRLYLKIDSKMPKKHPTVTCYTYEYLVVEKALKFSANFFSIINFTNSLAYDIDINGDHLILISLNASRSIVLLIM